MRCDGPRNRFQGNENEAEGGARVHQHTYKAFREKEGGAPCGIQRGTFSIIWEREGRCVIEFVGKSEREANCKSPDSGTAGGRPRRGIRRRRRSTTGKTRSAGSVSVFQRLMLAFSVP